MVDDADVPPLPRRVPGASDSPKPAVRIDRTAIPEDLRQRVLTAIAEELKRDEAERRLAREQDGAALEFHGAAGPVKGGGTIHSNGGGVGLANGQAPAQAPVQPELTQRGVVPGGAAPGDETDLRGGAAGPGAQDAPGHEPVTPPDWPVVPLPRRAPGANGAPQPPTELRREFLPPSLLGRRLDPEAHTEPLQRIAGLHPDVPVVASPPAAAPPEAPAAPASGSEQASAEGEPAETVPPDAGPADPSPPPTDFALAAAPTTTVPPPGWAVPELAAPQDQAATKAPEVPPKLAADSDLAAAPTMPAPQDTRPRRVAPASPASPKPAPPASGFPSWPSRPGPAGQGTGPAARPVSPASAPPKEGQKPRRSGRRWRVFGGIVAVAALVAAALIALLMSGGPSGGHHTGQGPRARAASAAVRNRAAAWVAGQVSRAAVVACDPVTCQALRAHGIPAVDLYPLGAQTTSPLRSQVIVATAVRAQFGNLLSSVYAPAVLASFGSGADRIEIRQTAPHGAAAYRASLNADMVNRKASGNELLHSGRVSAAAERAVAKHTASIFLRLGLHASDDDNRRVLAVLAYLGR